MEIQVLDDSGSDYKNLRPCAVPRLDLRRRSPRSAARRSRSASGTTRRSPPRAGTITVKLNGTTIVDANLDDVKDEKMLKKHPGLARAKGHIGFLGHGTRVEFRSMQVKELK